MIFCFLFFAFSLSTHTLSCSPPSLKSQSAMIVRSRLHKRQWSHLWPTLRWASCRHEGLGELNLRRRPTQPIGEEEVVLNGVDDGVDIVGFVKMNGGGALSILVESSPTINMRCLSVARWDRSHGDWESRTKDRGKETKKT